MPSHANLLGRCQLSYANLLGKISPVSHFYTLAQNKINVLAGLTDLETPQTE